MNNDQEHEMNRLADFLGRMILKYADRIDFDSLPDPDHYLTGKEMFAKYSRFSGLSQRWRERKYKIRDWKMAIEIDKDDESEKTDNIDTYS